MCSVLEAAVSRIEHGDYVDPEMIAGLVRFFDEFVHRSHQRKKEEGLFPLLRAAGGPVGALVDELVRRHRNQTALVEDLSHAFQQVRSDPSTSAQRFVAAARRFVAAMLDDGQFESEKLQPIVEELPPDEEEGLCRRFAEIERSALGPTGREWFNQVVADYRDIVAVWGTRFDRPARVHPGVG